MPERVFKFIGTKQGFDKYLANTSWMVGEKTLRLLLNLAVGIYLARYLGPQQFGLLSFVLSFVGIFLFLATLGLDSIVIRELVQTPEKQDEILGTAFILKLFATLLMWAAVYLASLAMQLDPLVMHMVAIFAASIVFQSMHVISFNFQARVQGKYLSLSLIIQMLIGNLLKIYCILIKAPLVVFVWVYFIEGMILALTLTMTYLKQGGALRSWKYRATRAKTLLKDSWLLVFSGVLVAIYMKIDIVMLREMAGDQAAGIYAASAKISEAWYFIPVAICASLFPAILAARASSPQKYNSQMQHLFTLLAWVAIAIAVVISFTGQWLVDLTFGKAYSDAGLVLVVHIWSGIFVFLGVASSKWLIAENLQQKIFNRSLVGAVSNILLNWLLIEPYGALGAAIATLVSYIIFAYVYDLIDREMRSVFVMKSKALFLPFNRAH